VNPTSQRTLTAAVHDEVMKKLAAMLREWALKPKEAADAPGIAVLGN
jgi:hypothetical protein